MDICEAIKEAKCCSGRMAANFVTYASTGDDTDELFYNFLRVNAYIRTLERNKGEIKRYSKKLSLEGQEVSFSMLKRKNNLLFLDSGDKLVCVTEKIEPCLSDSDISSIIEKVKILCSSCNCNC